MASNFSTIEEQQFEEFANTIIQGSRNSLDSSDINMIELWIERLNTLSTMYSRLLNIQERTYYNTRISTILQLSDQLNVQIEALQDTNSNGMALSFQPTGGRYKIIILECALRLLREEGFNWSQIAEIFNVLAKTIYRRRKEFNIPDDLANYMNITDDQLDNIVKGLRAEHPFFGQVLLMGSNTFFRNKNSTSTFT
ncbi:hypothetical protein RirG_067810 [Rhizophagus irregularis DAOM 197198w]|uniref:Uncharacterized protein n=1 Tax=Rhizophagus irregularis (strain DAOM 197198w) TaxID=1432141 RepID=A0A015JSQ7_RHIIW|nr:hypothetical protein RirG_067810 [Rhizophagus irregularis DAOM 197198w]